MLECPPETVGFGSGLDDVSQGRELDQRLAAEVADHLGSIPRGQIRGRRDGGFPRRVRQSPERQTAHAMQANAAYNRS